MIKKKNSAFAKRYQASYETKDKGGFTKSSVMDWKKIEGEVAFYNPVEGRNRINIVPYEIKTKNHPLVRKGDMEIGDMDYVMDVWVHRGVGPTEGSVLCLKNTFGKPCPICEQSALLRNQGKDAEADDLKASRRVFYNVIDAKEPDKVKVFETSHFLFEKELIDEARDDDEGGFVDFADPEDGKEIKFRANKVKKGNFEFLEFKSFSFEDREKPISDNLLEEAISFDEIINVPTYDEAQKLLFGDDDEDEDDEPKSRKPSRDEEEDEEEDYEEEKPQKSRKHEDEDDEEEEEEPKPKKSSRKSDEDEDEEDDEPKGKCKFGHKFGKDCDNYDDCDKCDAWEKCFKNK